MYSNPAHPSFKHSLANLVFKTGLFRVGRKLWGKSLTVLNYHRIEDPDSDDFDSFKPNVSARPTDFERQMEYLSRWFNVVSLSALVRWLDGQQELPLHAALITFDDGYLDNYTHAYPILRKHNLPAVIFLATDHIGTDAPFYWDLAAYCFHHTRRTHLRFPDGTERDWTSPRERDQTCKSWVEALKPLPHVEKQQWVDELPGQLDVAIPKDFFRRLMMNWEQVREAYRSGIEFGGHTRTHPILSRVPMEQARIEIEESKARIEQELGDPTLGFAYPNGQAADFNPSLEQAVRRAGYRAAFNLMSGPSTLREVQRNPFSIRRIFISHLHTLPHFELLTSRFNRYRG